ncbi:hypothetical protein HanIR_Chr09g0438901 [Helianthus annuus]|nr:hypothetical protein HanIR_Chr09g0438901 [Helianthus annuus]
MPAFLPNNPFINLRRRAKLSRPPGIRIDIKILPFRFPIFRLFRLQPLDQNLQIINQFPRVIKHNTVVRRGRPRRRPVLHLRSGTSTGTGRRHALNRRRSGSFFQC